MSINLGTIAHKKFEAEAIQAFQDMAKLRGTTRLRDAKNANQVQFQVIGATTAELRGAIQTPIPLADVTHTVAIATVKDFVIAEMTDIFKDNQTSVDERSELVESMTSALGRRLDQIIIDEMVAATITKTVADDIESSGTPDNLNVAMFNESARLLGSDVPDTDRFMLVHDNGFYHFLREGDVKDIDINVTKALALGKVPEYHGFNILKIGDRKEGGLPGGKGLSATRKSFAWQKSAIGLAMNMNPKIRIDYVPTHGAWIVTAFMSAGAVIIQTDGVVEISTDELA